MGWRERNEAIKAAIDAEYAKMTRPQRIMARLMDEAVFRGLAFGGTPEQAAKDVLEGKARRDDVHRQWFGEEPAPPFPPARYRPWPPGA